MRARHQSETPSAELSDAAQRELLTKYVDAFERYDIEALTTLIAADATQSMPPWAMWLEGRDEMLAWWVGPGAACRGSKLIVTEANGSVAFGQYKIDPAGGHAPWALQLIRLGRRRHRRVHVLPRRGAPVSAVRSPRSPRLIIARTAECR